MALNFPADTSTPYVDPTSGIKYIFNGTVGAWEAALQPPAIVAATQPDLTIEGFFWWDSINNLLYVYDNGQWIAAGGGGGGSTTVTVGSTPPGSPSGGDLWWDDVSGRLFIYYTDVDSSQWVDASPNLAGTNGGGVISSESSPPNPVEGDLWFNTLNSTLNVYHNNAWEATQSVVSGVASVSGNTPVTIGGTDSDPVVSVSAASTGTSGVIRIATQSEVNTPALSNVALTPATLNSGISNYLPAATLVASGVVQLATSAEVIAGSDAEKAITPAAFNAALSNLGIGIPAGVVISFAGSVAPVGYLPCDGSLVDRVTYANLFNAIGIEFGVGDGSTTFGVPDLRGEFVRGWDDSRGIDSGRGFATTQNSANLAHTHGVTDPGHVHSTDVDVYAIRGVYQGSTAVAVNTDGDTDSAVTGITIDSDGGTESRPRNIALLYCIKF